MASRSRGRPLKHLRRGPTRPRRIELPVDILDIELVQQEQPEERCPPRVRQRMQGSAKHVPASPPRDDLGAIRQSMLDLVTQNRIIREEMAKLKVENRTFKEEIMRERPPALPAPMPAPPVQPEPNLPIPMPRGVAR